MYEHLCNSFSFRYFGGDRRGVSHDDHEFSAVVRVDDSSVYHDFCFGQAASSVKGYAVVWGYLDEYSSGDEGGSLGFKC